MIFMGRLVIYKASFSCNNIEKLMDISNSLSNNYIFIPPIWSLPFLKMASLFNR
jgi:hypothetical protein